MAVSSREGQGIYYSRFRHLSVGFMFEDYDLDLEPFLLVESGDLVSGGEGEDERVLANLPEAPVSAQKPRPLC